jgi:DHA1 family tetracycline resistance protein-like MFS transporter
MLSAAFGIGFVLGPALGGVFGEIEPRLPFWVAAGLSLLNAMYGLFVLPESLAHDCRATFTWRRVNPIGSITLLRSNFELLGLAAVMFISYIAHEALPTTFVLYAMYRYHWNARMIGLSIATVGICSALVGAGMVQPLVAKFGERRTMLTGLWFNVAGFIAYALAPTGLLFCSAIPMGAMGGLSGPPMQGLMTRWVTPTEQGQLHGALGSIRGVAFMIGPLLFSSLFASLIGRYRGWHLPGAPYLLAAALMTIATIVAWRVTTEQPANAIAPATQPTEGGE